MTDNISVQQEIEELKTTVSILEQRIQSIEEINDRFYINFSLSGQNSGMLQRLERQEERLKKTMRTLYDGHESLQF